MDEELLRKVIDHALSQGCTYAEARWQANSGSLYTTQNGDPQPSGLVDSEGVAVRVIHSGALGFAATNAVDGPSLAELTSRAVAGAKASARRLKNPISLAGYKFEEADYRSGEKRSIEDVSPQDVFGYLKELDSLLSNGFEDVYFPFRTLSVSLNRESKVFMNSEGCRIRSAISRVGFRAIAVSLYQGRSRSISIPEGYSGAGGTGGWEVIEGMNLNETLPVKAKEIARALKATATPPSEETSVILGPNVASLTSHESVGHPFEADRILGREGAQAGESYLNRSALGYRLGSP
ncbi:MAG: DNA gyrase modulator, partial [Thermoprotei archaeon]